MVCFFLLAVEQQVLFLFHFLMKVSFLSMSGDSNNAFLHGL